VSRLSSYQDSNIGEASLADIVVRCFYTDRVESVRHRLAILLTLLIEYSFVRSSYRRIL
jgi:hypothetical protein